MNSIYKHILESSEKSKELLAVLIDPDKTKMEDLAGFMSKVRDSRVTHVFVGGSTVAKNVTQKLVSSLRTLTNLPIIIFPGDVNQITNEADGLLFLSLISGRNPEYLIGKHVDSVSKLNGTQLEVIPTGYILIENGKETAVERVTKTVPMSRKNVSQIVNTARAGELLGLKLIYLEAGSGATHPVDFEIIESTKRNLNIPLIVGGGIRSKEQLESCYEAGADIVVIGTAFEENSNFIQKL